jgi:viroplasmin and RNaseH domain-containing protein
MNNIIVEITNIYEKIIIKNINNYSIKIVNNDMIICSNELEPTPEPELETITYDELMKKNLRNSKIIYVKIDNQLILTITKYKKLLKYIYTKLDRQTIINNTLINISIEEINDRGYQFESDVGLSIQGTDAKTSLKEIINQITKNNQIIEIKIKLKSLEEIIYKS